MNGGYFDYTQYELNNIAQKIDELIIEEEYDNNTLEKFKETVKFLKITESMVQRIDWLVSGNDKEESFNQKWNLKVASVIEEIKNDSNF